MNSSKLIILIFSGTIGALYAELIDMVVTDRWQFISILLVVLLDSVLGISLALKRKIFEVKKAFKGVLMLSVFWAILGVLLTIERGFPYASFLSEAILLPIIVFQLISIIKNANLLGIITGSLADKILENIDNYKNNVVPIKDEDEQ